MKKVILNLIAAVLVACSAFAAVIRAGSSSWRPQAVSPALVAVNSAGPCASGRVLMS